MHRERPFFAGLVKFMTEGPIVVMALEREDAVKKLREVMGATNPANAAEGTIRKRFAANIERNCIHGSDAPETAEVELRFFFSTADCCSIRAPESGGRLIPVPHSIGRILFVAPGTCCLYAACRRFAAAVAYRPLSVSGCAMIRTCAPCISPHKCVTAC